MNPFEHLLTLSDDEKSRLGIEATPKEIAQQPKMWIDTASRFSKVAPKIRAMMARAGLTPQQGEVIFCGAGTSDFVGRCIAGSVTEALKSRALAVPTTDIVTHPNYCLHATIPGIMVSFARSGNSPESVAALDIAVKERPQLCHLIITCNENGELAKRASELGERAVTLILNPLTNDRGLAMTSSFSSMVVAGLGLAYLDRIDEFQKIVDRMAKAGDRMLAVMPEVADRLIKLNPKRGCFLGSGAAYGAAIESHLKLQELTDGDLICFCDTFLGIRHGPRAAIREDTLVTCFVANDPLVRRYEVDLIKGNRDQKIGLAHLIVTANKEGLENLAEEIVEFDPQGELGLPDGVLAPIYAIAGQLLGLFASLARGLKPDAPSMCETIHRVVQGVTIYPREGR